MINMFVSCSRSILKNNIVRSFNLFSSIKKFKDLAQITNYLLLNHKKIQPQIRIKTLNFILLGAQNNQSLSNMLNKQRHSLDSIIQEIVSQAHQLTHHGLNILLEILAKRYINYDRNIKILTKLNKIFFLMKCQYINKKQITKSINLLIQMKFPKITINKWISSILQHNSKENYILIDSNSCDSLKFFTIILQLEYISLTNTYNALSQILQHKFQGLDELSILWHVLNVIELLVKRKLQYQINTKKISNVLFNPFQNQNNQDKGKDIVQDKQLKSPQLNNQKQSNYASKIQSKSNQIFKLFSQKVSKDMLREKILKIIQSQEQQLQIKHYLLLSNIPELQQRIILYLQNNFKKLKPMQFVGLVKMIPLKYFQDLKTKYIKQMDQYMSLEQKLYLMIEIYEYTKIMIDKQEFKELIDKLNNINSKQFIGISKVLEIISKNDEQFVGKIITKLKDIVYQNNK